MNQEIKSLLGLKQEDLAMILNVSRGQLSMYLIGRRDLPIEAKLVLADLIVQFKKNKKQKIVNKIILNDEKNARKIINAIAQENYYKQIVLQKKLNALEQNYSDAIKTIELIDYLESQEVKSNNHKMLLYQTIKKKAILKIKNNGLTKQLPLKIELETLKNKTTFLNKENIDVFF